MNQNLCALVAKCGGTTHAESLQIYQIFDRKWFSADARGIAKYNSQKLLKVTSFLGKGGSIFVLSSDSNII